MASRRYPALNVSAGVLRVMALVAPPRAELELRTPTAIAAARGTEYLADVKPAISAFVVLRGTGGGVQCAGRRTGRGSPRRKTGH